MQAPHLAQPDKRASLQRDWVIWADRCILILVAWWFHGVTACLRPKSPVAHATHTLRRCLRKLSYELTGQGT